MPQTSLSADPPLFFRSDGAGNASRSTDPRIQTCSDRVLQALADYQSVLEEIAESMSASEATNSTTRLRHGMSRAATAIAIEEMAACVPGSLSDFSVKQAVLEGSKVFCIDNSWLEHLIHESIARDLAHLTKPRKSSPSWFLSVSIPSWSPRPWTKARAASEGQARARAILRSRVAEAAFLNHHGGYPCAGSFLRPPSS